MSSAVSNAVVGWCVVVVSSSSLYGCLVVDMEFSRLYITVIFVISSVSVVCLFVCSEVELVMLSKVDVFLFVFHFKLVVVAGSAVVVDMQGFRGVTPFKV